MVAGRGVVSGDALCMTNLLRATHELVNRVRQIRWDNVRSAGTVNLYVRRIRWAWRGTGSESPTTWQVAPLLTFAH